MDLVKKTNTLLKLKDWAVDMWWVFSNLKKVRVASEQAITYAPYCPRHDARMEFQSEEEYWVNGFHTAGEFKRHYKCPLCQYTTYNIYTAKKF
ncbi:MAG: hypothetical protein J7501_13645 [Bdellovibrio sp.]|nr:hypothetical protein [Bdellovibrio sp.]